MLKSTKIIIRITAALIPALFILSGCSSDSPTGTEPAPETNPKSVSKEIGPEGGSITSKDGKLILTFPEGALGSAETITISPVEESEVGSEFDPFLTESEVQKAYELEPDGLTFDQPVNVQFSSDQRVTQESDSVTVGVEFLLLSSEGDVEPVAEQSNLIDPETGELTLSGSIQHFSKLVSTRGKNWPTINWYLSLQVEDVPDRLGVNTTQSVEVWMFSNLFQSSASYTDQSDAPFTANFGSMTQTLQTVDGQSTGRFTYSCTEPGNGLYRSVGSAALTLELPEGTASLFIGGLKLAKSVLCEVPSPVLNTPLDKAEGLSLNTTLDWKPVNGVTSYTVQIVEEGKDFDDPETVSLDVVGTSADALGLKAGTAYKWRVRSNEDNNGWVSDWSEVRSFTTGTVEFGFGDLKVCVEHGTVNSDILWLWQVYGALLPDFSEILIKMEVELPNGTLFEFSGNPSSAELLLMSLEIFTYGSYKWRVKEVTYKGETVQFEGDSTSGEVDVTSAEQNAGDCSF